MSTHWEYKDAIRILGGDDGKILDALDKLSSGILLGAAIKVPALLGLLEARAEFVRLSRQCVGEFKQRRAGLTRWTRTQRLEAALGVLLLVSYFEELGHRKLPFNFEDLQLTKQEEITIATGNTPLASSVSALADAILKLGQDTIPQPTQSLEEYFKYLENGYYRLLSESILTFVSGLAVWDQLDDSQKIFFARELAAVPQGARSRYQDMIVDLSSEFSELRFWFSMHEHRSTRAKVGQLSIALQRMADILGTMSSGSEPDLLRDSLARAYAADLDRPIVESGDIPEGMTVPKLGMGYIPSLFRVREIGPRISASNELQWQDCGVQDNLEDFLVGHLTSSKATRAPLIVLGQPGSGKSVLTRILAGRLPAADFMPIRVVLRDVPAEGDVQDQIEYAIRDATGERCNWPTVSRNASDALPVVILDGFDELLQATGISQTDYLFRVARFQWREADQGRPVAVIVTSRVSVADRAKAPEETLALRLDPFDESRIKEWVTIWNDINVTQFSAQGIEPLGEDTVLSHRELAEQPLLLLMLALYDADGNGLNALKSGDNNLQEGELYERLLRSFTRREVVKHSSMYSDFELKEAIEEELRRLSVVAFAMFNRRSQWVTDGQLNSDMEALGIDAHPDTERNAMRTPLGPGEAILGRFFFVHRSIASQDERRREAYEFLHATFGEFLVARMIFRVFDEIAVADAAPRISRMRRSTDDSLLFTLLSFAVLSTRTPILGFLAEMFRSAERDDGRSTKPSELLSRLFRSSADADSSREIQRYLPRELSSVERYSIYSANLLLLAICQTSQIFASMLFADDTSCVASWSKQALLWRSQLDDEEWRGLVDYLAIKRITFPNGPDAVVQRDILVSQGHFDFDVSGNWMTEMNPGDPLAPYAVEWGTDARADIASQFAFLCSNDSDVLLHSTAPLIKGLPGAFELYVNASRSDAFQSPIRALLDAWLLRLGYPADEDRERVYRTCMEIALYADSVSHDASRYVSLFIGVLQNDRSCSPKSLALILKELSDILLGRDRRADANVEYPHIVRCAMAFLGQDEEANDVLASVIRRFHVPDIGTALAAEAWVRLAELGIRPGELSIRMREEAVAIAEKRRQNLTRALKSKDGLQ